VEKKGIHWFVAEVIPQLFDGSFVYIIAGEGIFEPVIRKSIEENKLENDIFLLGWADDDMLRLLYNVADIFIMPNPLTRFFIYGMTFPFDMDILNILISFS